MPKHRRKMTVMSLGRRHQRFWFTGWFVAAVLAFPGCYNSGDGMPRQPVAGTVLVDGRRLSYGTIMFFLVSRTSTASVSTGAVIEDGRFSIPRNQGPIPGTYKLSISGEKRRPSGTDRERNPGKAPPAAAEKIPVRFNSQTELEVEIPEGGIKDLKIELDSK